jgi:hypothetical protein
VNYTWAPDDDQGEPAARTLWKRLADWRRVRAAKRSYQGKHLELLSAMRAAERDGGEL